MWLGGFVLRGVALAKRTSANKLGAEWIHIQNPVEGNYSVSGGKYTAVPASHTICGVLYRTIRKSDPRASIMTSGQVNSVAMPYSIEDVAEDFAKALPLIELVKDEEA